MTRKIALIILVIFSTQGNHSFPLQKNIINTDFPVLKGSYLEQTPPCSIPELFAPGIVSRDDYFEHSAAVFSPDKSEVYWSAKPNGQRYYNMYFMKMTNGKWTAPEVVPFLEINYGETGPVFSPDGNMLYFNLEGDICVTQRRGNGWSEAVKMTAPINSDQFEMVQSITENGSIYFARYNPNATKQGRSQEFYVSRKINGNYTEPEKLDEKINSDDARETAVYVAPGESYMIIEASKDSSQCDLYISYKMKDESWAERIKLPIAWGRFPSVSPDRKYLFFMKREGIYWVNTSFIDDLRPKYLN